MRYPWPPIDCATRELATAAKRPLMPLSVRAHAEERAQANQLGVVLPPSRKADTSLHVRTRSERKGLHAASRPGAGRLWVLTAGRRPGSSAEAVSDDLAY